MKCRNRIMTACKQAYRNLKLQTNKSLYLVGPQKINKFEFERRDDEWPAGKSVPFLRNIKLSSTPGFYRPWSHQGLCKAHINLDIMEEEQKKALRKCRVRMVSDINIEQMMDVFDSRELFTPIMMEYIKGEKNRPEKIRTMLDYLQRRGPKAFDLYLVCLRESGHDFVASYLLQEYLQLKGTTIALYNQGAEQNLNNALTQGEPEPIQTIYLAQETQQNIDNEMCDAEQPTEMELEGEGQTMVQESSDAGVTNMSVNRSESVSTSETPSSAGLLHSSLSNSSLQSIGYTRNFAEEYVMESNPRGYLLIIDNCHFHGAMSDRTGTEVDCDQLAALFMKLGFGVDIRKDQTSMEIRITLEYLSKLDALQHIDSLLVAILTHGSEEMVYGVDGEPVSMFEVFQPFTSERCPALHHKPKFFIINACRGDYEDKGAVAISLNDTNSLSKDADPEKDDHVVKDIIPNLKDFLVAYSTVPKHVSWRHQNDGSWFVQALAKVFDEYAAVRDVVNMLILVNREVAKNGIQIPAPQIMLTKTWFLNPV